VPTIDLINFGIVSGLIGLTIFLLFLCGSRWAETPYRYLAVFFTANLFSQFDDLLWSLGLWKLYPALNIIYLPVLYLIAPSIYLYVRSLVSPETVRKNYQSIKHAAAFIITLTVCMPYYFLDSTVKLERLLAPAGTLDHLGYITFGPKIVLLCIIPFSLIYLVLALRLLGEHQVSIKSFFSNIENKDLSWLRWSVIILFIALLESSFQLFLPSSISEGGKQKLAFLLFEFAWIATFSVLAIRQKPIFASASPKSDKSSSKYSHSQISEEDRKRIEKKLHTAMEKDQLHRNASITLRLLSDSTQIPENRISQVLNTSMQQNFYDFINSWRINDACQKMQDGQETILQIAYAVGFNSRSTFNAAFKKHTGKTPSVYRQEKGPQKASL